MQSLKNMKGYSVIPIGGKVGTVEDYYIDLDGWVIRYIVVDGGEWLDQYCRKKVR